MPLSGLPDSAAVDPELIAAATTTALADVRRHLNLADRTDPPRKIVAHRIIARARHGGRDPGRLRDLVLNSLSGVETNAVDVEMESGPAARSLTELFSGRAPGGWLPTPKTRPELSIWRCFAMLFVIAFSPTGNAQEHRTHPFPDLPLHEKFYSTWYMPDEPTRSCCGAADCYPTEVRLLGDVVYARRREDGKWLRIPSQKVEHNRDNPDGRNHLCAPPPMGSDPPDTVYCFALGPGT
jgi:hypothetical protein